MYTVEFYETEDGKKPVKEYLSSLEPKMHAKVVKMLKVLAEHGRDLREPFTKPLDDGIFELRVIQGSNLSRTLFFFYVGNMIVVTNGFIKKTAKTPPQEIQLAKLRKKDYYRQKKNEEKEKERRKNAET